MKQSTVQLYGSALHNIIRGLSQFQRAYADQWKEGTPLAQDGVNGEAFVQILGNLQTLLGSVPEQLDRAAIDRTILAVADRAGFTDGLLPK